MTRDRAKPGSVGKGARRPPAPPPAAAKRKAAAEGEETHLEWGGKNYRILAAAGLALVAGFVLLALGDTVLSPILLVGGYLVLIPWGIVARSVAKEP